MRDTQNCVQVLHIDGAQILRLLGTLLELEQTTRVALCFAALTLPFPIQLALFELPLFAGGGSCELSSVRRRWHQRLEICLNYPRRDEPLLSRRHQRCFLLKQEMY